jgi:competence protein ComEC
MTINLPGYVVNTGKPSFLQIVIYYTVMFSLYMLLFGRKIRKRTLKTKRYAPGQKNILTACATLTIGIVIISVIALYNDSERMIFMSIGQGDAIAIRTGDGVNICVDGGSTSKSQTGRYTIAPCLKSQGMARVDYWFVSHTDEDHISGLEEILELGRLTGVEVENLVFSKYVVKDDNYNELCELADAAGVNIMYMDYTDIIGSDVFSLVCYYPALENIDQDKNAASLTLCYESSSITLWLTGDVDAEGMDKIAENYSEVSQLDEDHISILKMPHHGSKYSISESFYSEIKPDIAVISCGKNNLYGHPHTETMDALDEYDIPSLITWQTGAVVVDTKSDTVSVTGYRK